MLITQSLLDTLTAQAKASPRRRMNYDLRDSAEDGSQRMLNAIEPGTVIPVHRHTGTSEDVIILRGKAEEVFFDADGNETACFQLIPGGGSPAIHVPMFASVNGMLPLANGKNTNGSCPNLMIDIVTVYS